MFSWLKKIFDRSNDPIYSCDLYCGIGGYVINATDLENPSHTWILESPADLWNEAIDAAMEKQNEQR